MNILRPDKNCCNCKHFKPDTSQRCARQIVFRGRCLHDDITSKSSQSHNENCTLWEADNNAKNDIKTSRDDIIIRLDEIIKIIKT